MYSIVIIMFLWVIGSIIGSLLLIILIHEIYKYFTDILTNPKEKNLLESSYNQYRDIYDSLYNKKEKKNVYVPEIKKNHEKNDVVDMKNELKNFLQNMGDNNIMSDDRMDKGVTFLH